MNPRIRFLLSLAAGFTAVLLLGAGFDPPYWRTEMPRPPLEGMPLLADVFDRAAAAPEQTLFVAIPDATRVALANADEMEAELRKARLEPAAARERWRTVYLIRGQAQLVMGIHELVSERGRFLGGVESCVRTPGCDFSQVPLDEDGSERWLRDAQKSLDAALTHSDGDGCAQTQLLYYRALAAWHLDDVAGAEAFALRARRGCPTSLWGRHLVQLEGAAEEEQSP